LVVELVDRVLLRACGGWERDDGGYEKTGQEGDREAAQS
jgi:hypothetical protein